MIVGHCSSLHDHGIPGMLFPTIYKKKRTERGHSATSSRLPTVGHNSRFPASQFNPSSISTKNTSFVDDQGNHTSNISTKSPSAIDALGKQQGFECKVDHHEATNKVRKVHLESIDSEGIDGMDKEKAKQWEEQWRVFQERADKFIARMHLVQGDRRFSPWKGSVVDSVIGVFLTQNVSDHLSSNAFMSLAARFPPKSESNDPQCFEETTTPEICILDLEDTKKCQEEKSNQPAYQGNKKAVEIFMGDKRESDDSSSWKENGFTGMECSECHMQNLNKERSDKSNTSIEPITCSSNDHFQMVSDTGVMETESLESLGMLTEENLFSSAKNKENWVTEQSGVTAESVNEAAVQNNMSVSFQEAQKSPSEDNHACRALEVQNLSRDSLDITDSTSILNNSKSTEPNAVKSRLNHHGYLPGKGINGMSSGPSRVKRGRIGKQKKISVEWDSLRSQAQAKGKRERTTNTMDSLDYEALGCAEVREIADAIRERGMYNKLAKRIKDFLNRLVREHGSIDLEWLRDVPPDKAREYLLSFEGLGLKSVECVLLLTLHHPAFPVDTNVGRIAVRLGWVPLQQLPESLQLHLLELYPVLDSIQKYLWPRLCKLDQRTLYELHYQMITFGKVFCTKKKPNCNACPMKEECLHFASAFTSARLSLPAPEKKSIVAASESMGANPHPVDVIKALQLPPLQANEQLQVQSQINNYEPIVEVPATPEPTVEMPATPEPELQDIEDLCCEDPEEIPMIKLNVEEFNHNLLNFMQQNTELQEGEMSKALVALTPEAALLPIPELKNVSGLRTEHQVYELPDSHPLLERLELDKREPDDPCSYLLAIWTPGETPNSVQPPERRCSSKEFGELCSEETCVSCSSIREAKSQTVRGTLLIPCRTAMRGSFPLNGTHFQVNEVFADHESSISPIDVPRGWLWNLPRRRVFFGTSIPTIFEGRSTMESIQFCFWRGFVCLRGFDGKTRAPHPLVERLHIPASKIEKAKASSINNKEEQSRAIKLALAFDPQESHKGLGRAPDVLVAYSPPVENQRVGVEEDRVGVEEDSSGKRPLDTTAMEVPLTKVGQSESPQFTTRASLELAYALAQVALETFCRSNCEVQALEEAKETEKKLNEQIRSQAKNIEDLIKDNNSLKILKAALEGKDAEAQKKLEEATLEIKILIAKFATAQQKALVAFEEGYDCGYWGNG